jgi:hypothetical protein
MKRLNKKDEKKFKIQEKEGRDKNVIDLVF